MERSSECLEMDLKLTSVEVSLQKGLSNLKDLSVLVNTIQKTSEAYKSQLHTQKEICESHKCVGSIYLKKDNEIKNDLLQFIVTQLRQLYETKNFNLLDVVLQKLSIDTTILTPPKESQNTSPVSENNKSIKMSLLEDLDVSITEEVSFDEESILEIESTPTGKTSPIIQSKKMRCQTAKEAVIGEKKKCPTSWSTPETKIVKLNTLSPLTPSRQKRGGKMRQMRLNVLTIKQSNIVDLTSSPENSGDIATNKSLLKKEPVDDETILPSPTSGINLVSLKTSSKNSLSKHQKHLSLIKDKRRSVKKEIDCKENEYSIDESINILNPMPGSKQFQMPNVNDSIRHEDTTYCENASLVYTGHSAELPEGAADVTVQSSPTKQPLAENVNCCNLENESISLLHEALVASSANKFSHVDDAKRKYPEKLEPIYKEPTVRKKAEKMALPGWSCDDCKKFYDELYADNPAMLLVKMQECSRHRGRRDPARPRTPPGFWEPRWTVPSDTEEFNRRNDAR